MQHGEKKLCSLTSLFDVRSHLSDGAYFYNSQCQNEWKFFKNVLHYFCTPPEWFMEKEKKKLEWKF